MINIEINQKDIEFAVNYVNHINLGNRGHADGNRIEQITGVLGQSLVQKLFDIPMEINKGFDGGIDFNYDGKSYDVKTMGRTTYPKLNYVNNLVGLQDKYKVDRYIFCSVNKPNRVLTICGWIDKDIFLIKAKYFKEGDIRKRSDGTEFKTKASLYEIENKDLVQSNTIDEFINQLRSSHERYDKP